MHPTRATAACINLTRSEWLCLESGDAMDLWGVFRSYILNGYEDGNIDIPPRIAGVWGRCKTIIDKEAGI